MSSPAAIATVTSALRNLLTQGLHADPTLADATVTTQPLDRARANGATANQLNLFLYMTLPNQGWRNQPMPGRSQGNEIAQPPLALNLFYMLTPYGRDQDVQQPFSHQLLGIAMSTLHDHPLLGADELRAVLPDTGVADQIERIRITLQPLTIDDLSKLWVGLQYRTSVAYEVSVLLIDSTRSVTAALPALTRGQGDRGLMPQASLAGAAPTIAALSPLLPADPGATITITGTNLAGTTPVARLESPRLDNPIVLPLTVSPDGTTASFVLPDTKHVSAGAYMLSVGRTVPGLGTGAQSISTAKPLLIAPRITTKLPLTVKIAGGAATIALGVAPAVLPAQRVALLLGDREVLAPARTDTASKLSFDVPDLAPGSYAVRLRVDGVDSGLIDTGTTPPQFDPDRIVTVHA